MRRTASEVIRNLEIRIARLEGRTNNRTASMFSELARLLSDCIEDIYNGRKSLGDLRRDPELVSLETAKDWALSGAGVYGDYNMRAVETAIDQLYAKGLIESSEDTLERSVGGYPLEIDAEESFLSPGAVKYLV